MKDVIYIFIFPLAITLIIETIGGILMGVRKKRDILLVIMVNVVTNLSLNLLILLMSGMITSTAIYLLVYLILEPGVIFTEYKYYRTYMEEELPFLRLAIVLNILSIVGGVICQRIF